MIVVFRVPFFPVLLKKTTSGRVIFSEKKQSRLVWLPIECRGD